MPGCYESIQSLLVAVTALWLRDITFSENIFLVDALSSIKGIKGWGENLITIPSEILHKNYLQENIESVDHLLQSIHTLLCPMQIENGFVLKEDDFIALFKQLNLKEFVIGICSLNFDYSNNVFDWLFIFIDMLCESISLFKEYNHFCLVLVQQISFTLNRASTFTDSTYVYLTLLTIDCMS